MIKIGIDLGGSKIEVIALGEDGTELQRERVAAPKGDYGATVEAVAGLVEGALAKVGAGDTAASVGIGIPGAESRVSGLIKNANSTCQIGRPLKRDLEARLHREVRLANDANCFALSESRVFSDAVATRLLKPCHGDSSGVRGAAWLWP